MKSNETPKTSSFKRASGDKNAATLGPFFLGLGGWWWWGLSSSPPPAHAPPPPPPPPPPCALLLIPQGLGAFTFHSFQPQRTISPQLFIGAAAPRRSVRVQPSVRAKSTEGTNQERGARDELNTFILKGQRFPANEDINLVSLTPPFFIPSSGSLGWFVAPRSQRSEV